MYFASGRDHRLIRDWLLSSFPIMQFTSGSLLRPLIDPFRGLVTRPGVVRRGCVRVRGGETAASYCIGDHLGEFVFASMCM